MKQLIFLCLLAFSTITQAENSIKLPVVGIYDGDTFYSEIKRLPAPLNKVKIRLAGIDTPEKSWRADCEYEKELAIEAYNMVKELVGDHKMVEVRNYKWGKYGGRIVGRVYVDGVDIAQKLIDADLAYEYDGGTKKSWCNKSENQ